MALTKVLTAKQREVLHAYRTQEFRFLINSGSVRSGKTYIDNYLFLLELDRVRKLAKQLGDSNPKYILAGVSSGTIYTNIISELGNQFRIAPKTDRFGHYHLLGIEIVPAYTGSIRGMASIRGMTSYGAYINEASLADQNVFQEINNRCSRPGAHIICDTNPDHPEHWLKTQYIDKENDSGKTLYFNFKLEENTTLDQSYIEGLKATTPTGMFYDRSILGLWVSGQGLVYPEFDRRTMTISRQQAFDETYERFFVGVDWGFNHKTVFTVMGYRDGVYTLMEEHAASYEQIAYWVDVAKDIKERFGNIPFYCDTANPEHIYDLSQAGIRAMNANKNVLNGIEYVAGAMHNDKFRVVYDDCPQFRKEIYNYAWNEKTGDVIKKDDDCMDSMRYAMYNDYLDHLEESMSVEELARLKRYM